jgi:proline dehydrogenase
MTATLRKLAVSPLMPLLRTAARSYVVGTELENAVAMARSLAARGASSTVCFWDGPDDGPLHVAGRYLETLRAMARSGLDSYVSIKAPSLAFDSELVTAIVDEARSHGLGLHFDSLGPETAARTFELIEEARKRWTSLGCTLPGRWRRSLDDAERAVRLGLNVRVVKGQWPDPERDGIGLRQGYLEVVGALAGRARKVAVATHNPALAAAAIRRLQDAGTPCELELLFGLPSRAALDVGRKLGAPVRFYLPYGHAWLPYGLRQVTRNPRVLWWMLRDAWGGPRIAAPLSPAVK